jgi:hypothetical protein
VYGLIVSDKELLASDIQCDRPPCDHYLVHEAE